jgi:hypothetical protein
MKPVTSNIKTNNKCLNPVSTKCVTWDGPEITCLDGTVLCKGQSIEVTLYAIATKLCQVIDELGLEGINTCINQVPGGPNVGLGTSPTLQEVFSAIIAKVCALNDRVVELEGEDCPILTVTVPESSCLRGSVNPAYDVTLLPEWDAATSSLPATTFAEFVATVICSMLIDIAALQNSVDNINQQISDLWFALDNCANNCGGLVLPTCTYDYTLNEGEPVTVQTAYSWLEKDYCSLKSAIGTVEDIQNAVAKQCPDLNNQERLSSGGLMSGMSGWINNPTTLADSLNNAWLTICDMREAVSDILSGCCFSICNYLKFGYDLTWDPSGDYVDVTFNSTGSPVIYSDPNVPPDPSSPFVATPGGSFPAWASTVFPGGALNQSNVLLILNDGLVTVTIDTGQTINDWAIELNANHNGYRIDFTDPIFAGYDKTSLNQTINIYFTYKVFYNAVLKDCEVNQTDGFVYECCAPIPYGCDAIINTTGDSGTGMDVILTGVVAPVDLPVGVIPTGTGTNPTGNQLTVAGHPLSGFWPALQDFVITVSGGGQTQCRYITNIAAVGPNDVITVSANWSTVPAALPATVSYTIDGQYFALGSPTGNTCVDAIVDFSVKVIEVNSTFDANDPNTWTIATQNMNVSVTDIINQGYQVPEFYLDNNKTYAVAVYANFPCGQSDYTLLNYDSPILVSVTVQQGTATNPAAGVFGTTWSISVFDILSNGVSKPATAAGLTGPAAFAVALPQGVNLTEFKVAPIPAVWSTTQSSPVAPKSFCYCGIAIDPYMTFNVGGTTLSARDYVLGQYRGYSVEYLFRNPSTQAISPLLDSVGNAYVTDSLTDPTLSFSANAETANPFSTGTNGFTTGVAPILSSYQYSQYPFIIRYNPNNYKVDLSPKFHTITLGDITITIYNSTANPLPADSLDIEWHADSKQWNASLGQYQNSGGTYAQSQTFTAPSAILPVLNIDTQNFNPGTTSDSDYGSLVYQYLIIKPNGLWTGGPIANVRSRYYRPGFIPDPTSVYSCNNPNTITNLPYGTNLVNWSSSIQQPWVGTGAWVIGTNTLVTEDYICTIPTTSNPLGIEIFIY